MLNKRTLYSGGFLGALAAAFLVGSLTLGSAFANQPQPVAGADQAESSQETQDPGYHGSIQVPQSQANQSEQTETAALQGLAQITADQARQAALVQFPGANVSTVTIENENGSLVYSVQLTNAQGPHDVKVDAGTGQVLHVDAGDQEGPEGSETNN